MKKKTPIIAAGVLALSALFGFSAAPRQIDKTADLPFGNAPAAQSYNVSHSYKTADDVTLLVLPSLQSVQEAVYTNGAQFNFKAARPGSGAVWADVLLNRGHFRYYTDGKDDDKTFTTYAPGTLNAAQSREHDRLAGVYAAVVGGKPDSIPSNAPLSCEKPAGKTVMFCNRF